MQFCRPQFATASFPPVIARRVERAPGDIERANCHVSLLHWRRSHWGTCSEVHAVAIHSSVQASSVGAPGSAGEGEQAGDEAGDRSALISRAM